MSNISAAMREDLNEMHSRARALMEADWKCYGARVNFDIRNEINLAALDWQQSGSPVRIPVPDRTHASRCRCCGRKVHDQDECPGCGAPT